MFNQYSSLSDLAIIMSICKYCFAPYGPLIGFEINIQTYNHHSQLIPQIKDACTLFATIFILMKKSSCDESFMLFRFYKELDQLASINKICVIYKLLILL